MWPFQSYSFEILCDDRRLENEIKWDKNKFQMNKLSEWLCFYVKNTHVNSHSLSLEPRIDFYYSQQKKKRNNKTKAKTKSTKSNHKNSDQFNLPYKIRITKCLLSFCLYVCRSLFLFLILLHRNHHKFQTIFTGVSLEHCFKQIFIWIKEKKIVLSDISVSMQCGHKLIFQIKEKV